MQTNCLKLYARCTPLVQSGPAKVVWNYKQASTDNILFRPLDASSNDFDL